METDNYGAQAQAQGAAILQDNALNQGALGQQIKRDPSIYEQVMQILDTAAGQLDSTTHTVIDVNTRLHGCEPSSPVGEDETQDCQDGYMHRLLAMAHRVAEATHRVEGAVGALSRNTSV
jgi:hypothetical protein